MADRKIKIGSALTQALGSPLVAWRWAPAAGAAAVLGCVVEFSIFAIPNPFWWAVCLIAPTLTSCLFTCALYRRLLGESWAAASGEAPSPIGLQWTALEWRYLIAVCACELVFWASIAAAALVVAAIVMGAAAAQGQPAGLDHLPDLVQAHAAPAVVAALPLMAVAVWLRLRLALAPVASVASGRLVIWKAFALTEGHVWTILGAILVIGAVTGLIGTVVGLPFNALAMGLHNPLLVVTIGFVGRGVAAGAVQVPAMAGLTAYLYRRLAPSEPGIETIFD